MPKKRIIIGAFFIFLISCIVALICYYNYSLSIPIETMSTATTGPKEIIIESGTPTATIIKTLKKNKLIRNELTLKIYAKLHNKTLQAGRYMFSPSMSAKEIYNDLSSGKVTNDTIWVTFVEGTRLNYIAKQISDNFNFDLEEVTQTLDDKDYIKELITKYDILTEEILDKNIYHPLEGYLFSDTYEFEKTVTIKDIIEKMISTTEEKISKYTSDIDKQDLSIHKLLTLASIIELEGSRSDDRRGVAGVFYNRLNSGWTLGSDVTTYYAVSKTFTEDLTVSDLNSCNAYNTRSTCVTGLPIGPIASPSIESIEAAINPTKHDYYYFVADKNGKTYFSKTESEHNKTIRELKSKDLWYTYN